jgi:hypothetical protein
MNAHRTKPPARHPAPFLPGNAPLSFGSRGRSPSIKDNAIDHRALTCELEGETPGEPREWREAQKGPKRTRAGGLVRIVAAAGGTILLLALPLIGVNLAGHPVTQYLEFPPLTTYVEPAPFSWPAFLALAALILATVGPLVWRNLRAGLEGRGSGSNERPTSNTQHPTPKWGVICVRDWTLDVGRWALSLGAHKDFPPPHSTSQLPPSTAPLSPSTFHLPPSTFLLPLGLALGLVAWLLAWTRFPWFARFQVFTFSPLWLAYILVVNGLTLRRSGRCLLTHRPIAFWLLFPLSAAFWWFFEYLNRFVQNWHYVGIGTLTPTEYVIFATLPFATVLPAVLGTHDLLATFPRLTAGLQHFAPIAPRRPRVLAAVVLMLAAAGLALVGVWSDYCFPLLWVSPLVIITALQALAGRPTLFAPLAHGDWRRIWRLALSALICGFFWEMWNYESLAKWVYAVPFVHRFQIFEMPLLGYAGYIPFGLECAIVAELVLGTQDSVEPLAGGRMGQEMQNVQQPTSNNQHPTGSEHRRNTWTLGVGCWMLGVSSYSPIPVAKTLNT